MAQRRKARWTPGVKKAVVSDLKKGKSHWVSRVELLELHDEGHPVEALKAAGRGLGREFLIRFKPGKQGVTMAQKKQRLWVELEVRAEALRPRRFVYGIFNPRTGKAIEHSPIAYSTEKKAIDAGLAYLRATYNTGKPQKKRK